MTPFRLALNIGALEARGVKENFGNWNNFYDLKRVKRVCNVMPPEHRALTLSQLRILANMLRQRFVDYGGLPTWNRASSRDLWNKDKELHVLRDILPSNSSFTECFQSQPQLPDTYAHLLPEKTTYYVDALCRRRCSKQYCLDALLTTVVPKRRGELEKSANDSSQKTQRLLSSTSRGVLLILDQPTSMTWRQNVASLWCLYELFFAERQAIAWNLARIRVKAEAATCTVAEEKDILLAKLNEFGRNIVMEFEQNMTAKVPSRMLGPILRQAACMQNDHDIRRLRGACDIMAKLRCFLA
eukprot:g2353.t1